MSITKITIVVNGGGKTHKAEFNGDGTFHKGNVEVAGEALDLIVAAASAVDVEDTAVETPSGKAAATPADPTPAPPADDE